MKLCRKCSQEKPLSCFHKRGNGYQSACKDCKAKYSVKRYKEDPTYKAKRKVRAKYDKKRNREFLSRYKKFCKCRICGESEPVALDFHHLDPKEKDFAPSNLKTYSRGTIKREVRKCVVLCSNCHRKVHAGLLSI